ncbi:FAD-binding and (Fe-S)-binding domain-containing protein [Helicobacter himalayensis]|uniref:FAD-binding and (Fe-S)-binding domain-containing protein n=2 Tax=Helicobacter himalayensis TaxID=1591088 RepID=UPI003D6DE19A
MPKTTQQNLISFQYDTAPMRDYLSFEEKCREFLFDEINNTRQYRVFSNYLQRFAYGIDASCYRYIPKLVLKPTTESEVQEIIALSNLYNIPLTFRGAGTSLCGQACSDSVLVVCVHKWQNIRANEDSIWCDCGVIGVEANNALKGFGKKIGPDPATINNATIGGIFSNNSSGMCCGVKQNSYQTIKSVRVILHDGFILDTSDSKNIAEFARTHKNMLKQILELREEIVSDSALLKEINRKFAIKNTTGYSLNALSDFDEIKDILNHIFIGAEGTLGFVSRVEYFTVTDFAHKACALLFYENLQLAAKAIKVLSANDSIVSAAEIMDYACLKAVADLEGMPEEIKKVNEGNCCILIQLESNELKTLEKNIAHIKKELDSIPTLFGLNFSFDAKIQEKWWKVRKGLLPISASTKRDGATVITEDICFEIDYFAKGIEGITRLFKEFDFEGIIFGHALSGNVHFIITPLLDDKTERENFARFMDSMVALVVELKGSTKAEHGTGRMMAPFVEQEWGKKAYKFNQRIKQIFDSKNLFNPDVIICADPQIHIKNLKPTQKIEDYMNACMECGFCEKVCPSKNITLTPRQRIAVHREIERLKAKSAKTPIECEELDLLESEYDYFGVSTCATCSMCSTLCPLEIDSAKIAVQYKNAAASKLAIKIAKSVANNMPRAVKVAKWGVGIANFSAGILGANVLKNLSLRANRAIKTPIVPKFMPRKNTYILESKLNVVQNTAQNPQTSADSRNQDSHTQAPQSVLYFSSCLNRAFAPARQASDTRSIQEVFESLCARAGVNVIYPRALDSMCCGKSFKDYTKKAPEINPLLRTLQQLLVDSHNGAIPIVCDHSACSGEVISQLKGLQGFENLRVYDMSVFVAQNLLPRLKITKISENIGIYAVCSAKKGGFSSAIKDIAKACTIGKIYEHEQTYCCGFAGNKGFITPELNISATKPLAEFFNALPTMRCFSSSSTCEIGLSDATNRPWQHIIYLLDSVCAQDFH